MFVMAQKPTNNIEIGDDYCSTKITATFSINYKFIVGGTTDAKSIIDSDDTATNCDQYGTSGYLYHYDSTGSLSWKKLFPRRS
jgi:hypothetical protein